MTNIDAGEIQFYDYHPKPADFHADVIQGLQQAQKVIPPKYFYDQRGSQLFDNICELPEYYPTRTELSILESNAADIAKCIGPECLLVEPGSGSSHKVRILLDTLKPQAYIPMDISKTHLIQAAKNISTDYPWLDVHASCIDFTEKLHLPNSLPDVSKKVAFFPGSSIGNFEPEEAVHFLRDTAEMVEQGGGLLIGVDLKKEVDILNAAYNDSQSVTADFNLNLLQRINNELDGGFDLDSFEHHAFYNEEKGRIEMHLVSSISQQVVIDDMAFDFDDGETIHTECSYKYTVQEFQGLAKKAGFRTNQVWLDNANLFSVHYFTVV